MLLKCLKKNHSGEKISYNGNKVQTINVEEEERHFKNDLLASELYRTV